MATRQTVRTQKVTVRTRLLYAVVGVFIWVIVSLILIGVAVEQFQKDKDYLSLGLWGAGILVGYVVFLYILGVRRKKPPPCAEEPDTESE